MSGTVVVTVVEELRFLLSTRDRHGQVSVPNGTNSLLHVVESLGIPRTEIGRFVVNDRPVVPGYRPRDGDHVVVEAPPRAEIVTEQRFLLDVHLGTLARRMRLLGVDTAYSNDADDAELLKQAIAENRVLLTRDRGLLRRRALPTGAFVRGQLPDDQLTDVLDRFAPALAPWTRCPACNGMLRPSSAAEVAPLIEPGTRRTHADFHRCRGCGRAYWRGAHAERLARIVASCAELTRGRAPSPLS
jgi:uncharacterized protein with PIN domain